MDTQGKCTFAFACLHKTMQLSHCYNTLHTQLQASYPLETQLLKCTSRAELFPLLDRAVINTWKHNGCLSGSFQAPWCSLGECGEQYCLVWESRFLRDLGSAMTSLLDGLVSMVAQEALKYTVLSGRRKIIQEAHHLLTVFYSSSFSAKHLWIYISLTRHLDGPHLACVFAGSSQHHWQSLVCVPEPLSWGGETSGTSFEN